MVVFCITKSCYFVDAGLPLVVILMGNIIIELFQKEKLDSVSVFNNFSHRQDGLCGDKTGYFSDLYVRGEAALTRTAKSLNAGATISWNRDPT